MRAHHRAAAAVEVAPGGGGAPSGRGQVVRLLGVSQGPMASRREAFMDQRKLIFSRHCLFRSLLCVGEGEAMVLLGSKASPQLQDMQASCLEGSCPPGGKASRLLLLWLPSSCPQGRSEESRAPSSSGAGTLLSRGNSVTQGNTAQSCAVLAFVPSVWHPEWG